MRIGYEWLKEGAKYGLPLMDNRGLSLTNHVFYHGVDLDGECSGAIAYDCLKDQEEEIKLYPINYGDDFPWDDIKPEDTVYMLDYALQPYQLMRRLEDNCKRLIWIDHHISAIDQALPLLTEKTEGRQDHYFAACQLTWMWFQGEEATPRGVELIGNYDIWNHEDPDVLAFQYGLRGLPTEPTSLSTVKNESKLNPVWGEIFRDKEEFINMLCARGGIIQDYEKIQTLKKAKQLCIKGTVILDKEPYNAVIMNYPFIGSKGFEGLYDENEHDLMVTFHMIQHGLWTVSLYTTHDTIDVSKICHYYGGGGHQKAGGFQCGLRHMIHILGLIL